MEKCDAHGPNTQGAALEMGNAIILSNKNLLKLLFLLSELDQMWSNNIWQMRFTEAWWITQKWCVCVSLFQKDLHVSPSSEFLYIIFYINNCIWMKSQAQKKNIWLKVWTRHCLVIALHRSDGCLFSGSLLSFNVPYLRNFSNSGIERPSWQYAAPRFYGKVIYGGTLSCPWTFLSCFWASAACLLAWLSWISISFRSPSIFFFTLRASFRLRTSASSMACIDSVTLWWFLLIWSISSSFSTTFRSTSPLIWLRSICTWRILDSSCSREALNIFVPCKLQ